MNGAHDMGGMDGFGPVQPETNEPVFHEEWEGRALAMNRAMGFSGAWNGDISRYAKEQLAPADYLGSSYYRRWILGLECGEFGLAWLQVILSIAAHAEASFRGGLTE